jgi:hypothetical protein
MTTASAPAVRAANGLSRMLPLIGLALAVAALLLLVAGPLGWRAGWWRFSLAFSTLMPLAAYVGIAAMAVSALALALVVRRIARRGVVPALLGIVIGGVAAYFPWAAGEMRGKYPRLNDITTDFQNPPSLVFSEPMRKDEDGGSAAYGGAEMTALQQKSYPGIEPAMLALPPWPRQRQRAGRSSNPMPPPAPSKPMTAAAGSALPTTSPFESARPVKAAGSISAPTHARDAAISASMPPASAPSSRR